MSSYFGNQIRIQLFGESHGEAMGVVVEGLPPGFAPDMQRVQAFLERRKPKNALATGRREADEPLIQSGLLDGRTTGAPLCAIFPNRDARSADYVNLSVVPRPGHADYPLYCKTSGNADLRGGGHASGRLTVALCFAGALCIQLLEQRGVTLAAHLAQIASEQDIALDSLGRDYACAMQLSEKPFPVLDDCAGERMQKAIAEARGQGDSVGGMIEAAVYGLPPGLGNPPFFGLENRISAAVFAVPGVNALAFGSGFDAARLRGSEQNDAYIIKNGQIETETNRHGGVLGGMATGMPLIFRAGVKPPSSISQTQRSVDLRAMEETQLTVQGRHDACIAPRAIPCIEAAAAIALLDVMLGN